MTRTRKLLILALFFAAVDLFVVYDPLYWLLNTCPSGMCTTGGPPNKLGEAMQYLFHPLYGQYPWLLASGLSLIAAAFVSEQKP